MARKLKELHYDGIMRMVEGIILGVLDKISISGKWLKRDISMKTLEEKRILLNQMRKWMKDEKWDIWLDFYCEYYGRDKRAIKKNFNNIRRQSTKYVKERMKAKANAL